MSKVPKTSSASEVERLLLDSRTAGDPAADGDAFFEQYKLYVGTMEALVVRRQSVHTFFMTANTFLLSVAGLLLTKDFIGTRVTMVPVILAAIAGCFLSLLWWQLTHYYAALAGAKFEVIHAYERHLPSAPFIAEWQALRHGADPQHYTPTSAVEAAVPLVFCACYLVVLAVGVGAVLG